MALLLLVLLLPQQKFYNYYQSAVDKLEESDASGAIQDLEKAIALRPEPSANARTYGVQVKPYFPYSYLAAAYWLAKDPAKARRALNQALEKGEKEMGDENTKLRITIIATGLANMDLASKQTNSGNEVVKPRADLEAVTELALKGDLASVLSYLGPLLPAYPDDTRLKSLYELTQQQMLDRRKAQEQQRRIAATESMLKEARNLESDGHLESALQRFNTIATIDPSNAEASSAVRRLRAALTAKGRREADIEKAMIPADDEKFRRMQEELAESQALLVEQRKAYESKISGLEKPFNVNWSLIPNAKKSLTATVQVTVISESPLKKARLYVNNIMIAEWDIDGKKQFTSPRLIDFAFTTPVNILMVQCLDSEGHNLSRSYPYAFSPAPKIITKKTVYSLVIALSGLVAVLFFTYQMRRRRAFRARFNPYVAGAPILNERMFFGRSGLLKQILNALHNNSLMVFGPRRIGKTSFLHRLQDTLPSVDDPDYEFIPVFIDLQGVKEQDFFSALHHEISQTLAERGIAPAEAEASFGVRQFTACLRKYIAALKEQCQKKPKLVLLLDEVDVMNSFTEQTNQQLRSVFMKGFAEHLAAVMAGIHINTKWKSEGSPWYNFFEQIELKPFPREQAEELITRPVQGIYTYTKEAIDRILELTDGKPYLIQKLCLNLISYILLTNQRKITSNDVDLVFKDIEKEFTEPEV